MRRINYARLLPVVCLVLGFILLLESCDEDSGIQAPVPGTRGGGYDPVFNADGGFIITYGMLDKRYNEITFPGTHNSGARGLSDDCDCQDLKVWQQLANGIRHIEFDVNDVMRICHGACHYGQSLEGQFEIIRDYAAAHPHQIITVKIGDLCTGLGAMESYERINGRLENSNLDNYIYNWDPTVGKASLARCCIPDPWPTLRQMIDSGKNVMFFHSRKVSQHDVIDEGLFRKDFAENQLACFFSASELDELFKFNTRWVPPHTRQQDLPYHLFLVECEPDGDAIAGHRGKASINNDGRKLYHLAKQQETEILPDARVVNFIIIDYFAATAAGHLPIDVVDACNRLNYERFDIDWESCEGFWELYPYEFDDSKINLISEVPALAAEVEKAYSDFLNHNDLYWNARTGKIVSTFSICLLACRFRLIPEWAVDNDFITRWCGVNWDLDPPYSPPHAWAVDLGEPKAIDEIAIAWEYPHRRPGYKVFASNDDSRFADGISQEELIDDSGWTVVAEGDRVAGGEVLLWDRKVFQNTGTSSWRYVKVKVTNTGEYEWPTFYELQLIGSAN